jgi:hypothetical protein
MRDFINNHNGIDANNIKVISGTYGIRLTHNRIWSIWYDVVFEPKIFNDLAFEKYIS